MSSSLKQRLVWIVPLLVIGLAAGALLAWGRQPSASANGCNGHTPVVHHVIIKDTQAAPQTTKGRLCDKLTFTNDDNITRFIAFGPHENHVPYDGVAGKYLSQGQSFTITLNQAGSFHFHDHIHDDAEGYFIVSK